MTLKRLHESIEQHDTKEVKQILQEFVDVNCIYCQETALTKAIRIREQDKKIKKYISTLQIYYKAQNIMLRN
jgi:hypothetical protein